MDKIYKEMIIVFICMMIILITTLYLQDKLYGSEKIAWALWGLAIFIGTMISYKEKDKK